MTGRGLAPARNPNPDANRTPTGQTRTNPDESGQGGIPKPGPSQSTTSMETSGRSSGLSCRTSKCNASRNELQRFAVICGWLRWFAPCCAFHEFFRRTATTATFLLSPTAHLSIAAHSLSFWQSQIANPHLLPLLIQREQYGTATKTSAFRASRRLQIQKTLCFQCV